MCAERRGGGSRVPRFELRPLSYDHPDAQELTERAQAYYVELYGGRDDDPLAAAEFEPPRGGFVVGYLDGAPVAMGGWSLTASDLGDRVAKIRTDVRRRRRPAAGPGASGAGTPGG